MKEMRWETEGNGKRVGAAGADGYKREIDVTSDVLNESSVVVTFIVSPPFNPTFS
ncbi:hypothetical protein [Staphylococcus felis]|uniref:hypothetical protein n=1 Tax=Staphylococcus felis TaxID=46127 RepID=UPI0015F25F88|nr:hypothetical protein [Staphylococcus felis]